MNPITLLPLLPFAGLALAGLPGIFYGFALAIIFVPGKETQS